MTISLEAGERRSSSAAKSSTNQTVRPRLDSRTKSRSGPLAATAAETSPITAT